MHLRHTAGVASSTLAAALSASACTDREPDARSEYVDLYLDPGLEVCGGQLASYDGFIEKLFDVWGGTAVPSDFRVAVHARRRARCDGHSCASPGNTWLFGDPGQYHEIGHVIHYQLDGQSVAALEEGTAEALGSLGGIAWRESQLASVSRDFLYASELSATEYPHAAMFTRFLADRHGAPSFRSFFRRMGELDHPDQHAFDSAFQDIFAESVDAAWAEFVSGPRCAYDYWFCSDPIPLALPGEFEGIDCSDERTLGFDATSTDLGPALYQPTAVLGFSNDRDRRIRIELSHAFVYFGRCGDCEAQAASPATLLESNEENPDYSQQVLSMAAGEYFLIVRQIPGGTTRVTVAPAE